MSKWISIKDSPPNLHENVLFYGDMKIFIGYLELEGFYAIQSGFDWFVFKTGQWMPTHWMPLPEKPNE